MKAYHSLSTMRVSAKGEYATRAVLHLAMQHPSVATIHQIAAAHNIPVKYLEQILLTLRRGGIVASKRGVHGGYCLTRRPAEISVGEVLALIDGRLVESPCVQPAAERKFDCAELSTCGLQYLWQDVRSAVNKILFETSFADICARTSPVPYRLTGQPIPARIF